MKHPLKPLIIMEENLVESHLKTIGDVINVSCHPHPSGCQCAFSCTLTHTSLKTELPSQDQLHPNPGPSHGLGMPALWGQWGERTPCEHPFCHSGDGTVLPGSLMPPSSSSAWCQLRQEADALMLPPIPAGQLSGRAFPFCRD